MTAIAALKRSPRQGGWLNHLPLDKIESSTTSSKSTLCTGEPTLNLKNNYYGYASPMEKEKPDASRTFRGAVTFISLGGRSPLSSTITVRGKYFHIVVEVKTEVTAPGGPIAGSPRPRTTDDAEYFYD
ncbi:hypothetical protein EVAR_38227_1 [Eumeta japonica]|uniref:Uncharacterized protein n=1 Tax=Eumeta variegata TaxID=151549 RepID=A0A4C1XJ49_EUMVA|nr:hypothetical protein EVAR_38227_1 [Eumeta japonica]